MGANGNRKPRIGEIVKVRIVADIAVRSRELAIAGSEDKNRAEIVAAMFDRISQSLGRRLQFRVAEIVRKGLRESPAVVADVVMLLITQDRCEIFYAKVLTITQIRCSNRAALGCA